MKQILWREFYKFFHSWKLLLLCVCLLLFTMYAYSLSTGKQVRHVYIWEERLEDKQETWQMASRLTNDVRRYGGDANVMAGYLWMEEETMPLFEEGGALQEEWVEYDFPGTMVKRQMFDGYFAPLEQKDFGAYWKFTFTLMDSMAIAYTGILFAVFFFGADFTGRGYNGACYAGEDRWKTFFGKYLVFLVLMAGMSLLELLLATVLYNQEIFLLPAGYVAQGVGLRILKDLGVAMLSLIFPFLCKDEIQSLVLSFACMLFFFSTRAVVSLYPYQFIARNFWETMSDSGTIAGIVGVSLALIAGVGAISCILFQRAELK